MARVSAERLRKGSGIARVSAQSATATSLRCAHGGRRRDLRLAGGWTGIGADHAENERARKKDDRGAYSGGKESEFAPGGRRPTRHVASSSVEVWDDLIERSRFLTTPMCRVIRLGLAIARDLARAMGGDLKAESVPEEGSNLRLTLPKAG